MRGDRETGGQGMTTLRSLAVACTVLGTISCSSGQKTSTGRTERETDSVIGNSAIPGASGVKKAMAAQDSARARAAALDTVQ